MNGMEEELIYDSPGWHEEKRKLMHFLVPHEGLRLWLDKVWYAASILDDLYDGDKEVADGQIEKLAELTFGDLWITDPSVSPYVPVLAPILFRCVENWKAANWIEKNAPERMHISYGLRSLEYISLVAECGRISSILIDGIDTWTDEKTSRLAMLFGTETVDEYIAKTLEIRKGG